MTTTTPSTTPPTPAERARILTNWGQACLWVADQIRELHELDQAMSKAHNTDEIRRRFDRDDNGDLDPAARPRHTKTRDPETAKPPSRCERCGMLKDPDRARQCATCKPPRRPRTNARKIRHPHRSKTAGPATHARAQNSIRNFRRPGSGPDS
jgi:hypothetical protein